MENTGVAPVALVEERPARTWGLRSGSRSLDVIAMR
jgi:hypothetical protein